MSKPRVAVLMALYNGENFVHQQINSILKQKGVDVVIFCSIDLSSDNTHRIISEYVKEDKRIRILSSEEKFGNPGKNFYRLMLDSNIDNFDYVAFSDQDDIWLESKLIRALKMMVKTSSKCYSSGMIAFWPSGQERFIQKKFKQKKYDHFFESPGPGCSFVIEKESFLYFKKFLKKNLDSISKVVSYDWLIYSFFRERNIRWTIDKESRLMYRQHDNNIVGVNYGLKAIVTRFNKIKNGWYKDECKLISELTISASKEKFQFTRKFLLKNFRNLRRGKNEGI